MARTRDMTTGSPTRHLILFTLPIIAGNAFQQLYSLVDSFVVGQVSVDALTAVASAGWLDWLVLSLATGLAQGFGIQVAQSFGAGDGGQSQPRGLGQGAAGDGEGRLGGVQNTGQSGGGQRQAGRAHGTSR